MTYRAYIPGESETITDSPRIARAAFAELLARDDLIGQTATAVFERDGRVILKSAFEAPLGAGRIHPEAPIDVYAAEDDVRKVHAWSPRVC